MTERVSISRELFNRIRAFFRTMEDYCRDCFRREGCYLCDIGRGANLGRDMDREVELPKEKAVYATQNAEIADAIETILGMAHQPLPSRKIYVPFCTAQMKEWTLNKMISQGRVRRTLGQNKRFLYQLTNKGKSK